MDCFTEASLHSGNSLSVFANTKPNHQSMAERFGHCISASVFYLRAIKARSEVIDQYFSSKQKTERLR